MSHIHSSRGQTLLLFLLSVRGCATTQEDRSEVRKYYENANVLITGGTGFVGKILIRKLLMDTNPSKIYVLIREKRGTKSEERLDALLKQEVRILLH